MEGEIALAFWWLKAADTVKSHGFMCTSEQSEQLFP